DSKKESNVVCDKKLDDSKENSDNSLVKEQVSKDTSSLVESSINVDKETVFLVDKKVVSVKPKNHEKPVKNLVRSFNHIHAQCKYHQKERMIYGNNYNRVNYNYTTKRTYPNAQRNMVPRAILMKTGLKPFNTARTVNTAHPKSTVFSAKPMFTHKINTAKAQAVNTARPQAVNIARPKVVKTARPNSAVVNAVRVNQANAIKASACWGKPQQDDTGFVDSGCSRHMTRNIAYLLDFKEFDGGSGPRCQDTILGDVDAQTRFETASKQLNDPPLLKVNTFRSGEDSMQLMELMAHCTKLCEFVRKKNKKKCTATYILLLLDEVSTVRLQVSTARPNLVPIGDR
ncbi:hypothetical protein Tco_1431736, partial [Tanacetum coccineum]